MQISKSDYMLFLRQPAWLWLKKNDPSKLPPVDAATQAMFDAGHAFEPYVESLFPEGVALGFSDFDEYRSLPLRTQQAFESGAQVVFQPRFEWNGFTCISDIVLVAEGKRLICMKLNQAHALSRIICTILLSKKPCLKVMDLWFETYQ